MAPVRKLDFCPFCGGRPVIKRATMMGERRYRAACIKEACTVRPATNFYFDEASAVSSWNKRFEDKHHLRKEVFWNNRFEIKAVLHDHERICRSGQKKLQLNRVIWLLQILKEALDGRGRVSASKGEHISEG